MATEKLKYIVTVCGLFGRNRKEQRGSWPVCERAKDDPVSLDAFIPMAEAELRKQRFRGGTVRLVEQPLEERLLGGEVIQTWTPFGSKTLYTGTVEGPVLR